MNGSPPEEECPGVQVVRLELDPNNTLVVVLTEPLGCPTCGRTGDRWVVPTFQSRIFHRPDQARPDQGE